jgi:adenylosuccinate synthase
MDKTGRNGLRVGDLNNPNFFQMYNKLKEKHLALAKQFGTVEYDLEGEEQKWFSCLEQLKQLEQIDCEYYINNAKGKNIGRRSSRFTFRYRLWNISLCHILKYYNGRRL